MAELVGFAGRYVGLRVLQPRRAPLVLIRSVKTNKELLLTRVTEPGTAEGR